MAHEPVAPAETCWTMVRGVAAGDAAARDGFSRLYLPLVRSFFAARWRAGPLRNDLDDAVQEVFVECFRQGGALGRVEADRPGGFRAFLHGVVHNVARRFEGRAAARGRVVAVDSEPADAQTPSRLFEREWALSVMRGAGERQAQRARERGESALRRVELLRLRFQEGLPIREIASRWDEDPARLHHEYATARQEFREALHEEVAFHLPGLPGEVARESERLLSLLR